MLKQADKAMISVFKHLLGIDILDQSQYDLMLDLEEMSYEGAALSVVRHMESLGLYDRDKDPASLSV